MLLNYAVVISQREKGGNLVKQLKKFTHRGISLKALVVRNREEKEMEMRELVIGDIVRLCFPLFQFFVRLL